MKASAFAYARATSVGNALELLAAHGDKAKVLSGGQSLIPAMNLRLISPEFIVDISELDELRGTIVSGDAEGLVDLAAMRIGLDPVEMRRRNLIPDDAYPCASPTGLRFEQLSHHASLNKLLGMMDYEAASSSS
jgi:FAD binding domain in molybdopterin dehydrogenase/Molybdopterin-binding domain of aldehyde dehydrogenase